MSDVNVIDADQWKEEARAVINDITDHVKSASISEKIQSNNKRIYLNLVTIEGKEFCIELSGQGFRIVGEKPDAVDVSSEEYYETPYSLLGSISPSYTSSFGNALLDKLTKLYPEK